MSYTDTDAVMNTAETAEQAGDPAAAITALETEAIQLRADLAESQRSVRILLERRDQDAARMRELERIIEAAAAKCADLARHGGPGLTGLCDVQAMLTVPS